MIGAGFITIDTQLVGYAFTAMFIGLWSFYLYSRRMLLAGFGADTLAPLLSQFVGYKLHIVLAVIAVSAIFLLFWLF